jgi:glycosyltransferase involved in cell wall biosynthesis
MKIIATCRTKNDEAIIGRYCKAYQKIADVILIADGGSTDNTIEEAMKYPKVEVIMFGEEMEVNNGHKINPQGRHVNFLFDEAKKRGADWITFDDSDCVPNFMLQNDARKIMAETINDAVFLRRVYFWGDDQIFPKLHAPNTSLWAFRSSLDIRADVSDPWHLTMKWGNQANLTNLRPHAKHVEFGHCLLHFSWPTPEEADAKVKWYRESGVQPTCVHPLEWAGPIEPAAWFMRVDGPHEKRV